MVFLECIISCNSNRDLLCQFGCCCCQVQFWLWLIWLTIRDFGTIKEKGRDSLTCNNYIRFCAIFFNSVSVLLLYLSDWSPCNNTVHTLLYTLCTAVILLAVFYGCISMMLWSPSLEAYQNTVLFFWYAYSCATSYIFSLCIHTGTGYLCLWYLCHSLHNCKTETTETDNNAWLLWLCHYQDSASFGLRKQIWSYILNSSYSPPMVVMVGPCIQDYYNCGVCECNHGAQHKTTNNKPTMTTDGTYTSSKE